MRDLVGPPPCVTRIREIPGVAPGTRPRHHASLTRFLSRLASPSPGLAWRCPSWRALASLASPWRRRPHPAPRSASYGGVSPPSPRRTLPPRATPRSERPAVVGRRGNRDARLCSPSAEFSARGAARSSPSCYRSLSSHFIAAMFALEIVARSSYPRATLCEQRSAS